MVNLFGNEVIGMRGKGKKASKTLFDDYDGFVEKFKPKKTTDDCYTPPAVYDIILDYVVEKCNINGRKIIRPFYPGNDYETFDYPIGCVVVDNPPFSIITRIARFYLSNNIDFFLFAPHLTLFSADLDCTRIVSGANIIYENGAKVKTSFLSNLFGDAAIIGEPHIYEAVKRINADNTVRLPRYRYPGNVLTVSAVSYCVERGIGFSIGKKEIVRVSGLDAQRPHGKAIFGSGYLLSEKAAAEKAAAEKDDIIEWELSDREKKIIEDLGDGYEHFSRRI